MQPAATPARNFLNKRSEAARRCVKKWGLGHILTDFGAEVHTFDKAFVDIQGIYLGLLNREPKDTH